MPYNQPDPTDPNVLVGVVLPDPRSTYMQWVLDALGASVAVLYRTSRQTFESDYPGLEDLAGFPLFYTTASELADHIQTGRSADDAALARKREARDIVRCRHTVAHRLVEMMDVLRRRISGGAPPVVTSCAEDSHKASASTMGCPGSTIHNRSRSPSSRQRS
ncbi:MAG: glycosyltransferase family 1 protein [Deltaproteobacteria bacterium]|nr:glycosyltransferase family 1 protein [Deltaproteobacteria bacterium]